MRTARRMCPARVLRLPSVITLALALLAAVACRDGGSAPPSATPAPPSATAAGSASPTPRPTASASASPPATPRATATAPPLLDACDARFPAGLTIGQPVTEKFICIEAPRPNASVPGAPGAKVRAVGWVAGAFEQAVVIELRDTAGRVLTRQPVTATGRDIGLFAARWEVELTLTAASSTDAGALVAFTTSPRDGAVDSRASVPVRFTR